MSSLPVLEEDVSRLLSGSVENLLATYRRDGLFPYSCSLRNGSLACVYDHPQTLRYTINSLLGLEEAARASVQGVSREDVAAMRDTFVDRQYARLESTADLGLLVLTLASTDGLDRSMLGEVVRRLDRAVAGSSAGMLDMQALSWTVWGCCAAARSEVEGAEAVARRAMQSVFDLVTPGTGLPRHTASRYRRSIVSFGSLVYFLRACHEYGRAFDDPTALRLFEHGVERAIAMQGPHGEWPWMIDVRSGRPFDVYPVFSVHQDSMAMLFLLPSLDRGQGATVEAVRRSLAWCFGENELGETFYRFEPRFLAYRSIERIERFPRLRRYVRGVARRPGAPPASFESANVRVNQECRSYHLGWILYAWSGRMRSDHSGSPQMSTVVD